ncbi:hypothetical protein L486_00209 [Kwoniella mangroviensis CBS 10435]|uniref:Uncharacterized protein n=1 Tax=Kwoniella mangroviensis CBS 10435 TaxID=1331196 RepID=A0A1B9IYT3_9TREE|nr:hypothetical protein L486_00209 [Kwoniella mangroviensis CBS 10435]
MADCPAQLRPIIPSSTSHPAPLGESDINLCQHDPKDMILDINSMNPPPLSPEVAHTDKPTTGETKSTKVYKNPKEDQDTSSPLSEINEDLAHLAPPQIFHPITSDMIRLPRIADISQIQKPATRSECQRDKENQPYQSSLTSQQIKNGGVQPNLIFPRLQNSLVAGGSSSALTPDKVTFASSVQAGLNGKKIFVRERSRTSLGVVVKGEKSCLAWPWEDDEEGEVVDDGQGTKDEDDRSLFSTYLTSAQNSQDVSDAASSKKEKEVIDGAQPSQPPAEEGGQNAATMAEIDKEETEGAPQNHPHMTTCTVSTLPLPAPPTRTSILTRLAMPRSNSVPTTDLIRHHIIKDNPSTAPAHHVSLPSTKMIIHPKPVVLPDSHVQACSSSNQPTRSTAAAWAHSIGVSATTEASSSTQQLPLPQQGYQFPIPPPAAAQETEGDREPQVIILRRLLQAKEIIESLQDRVREVEMERDWSWASLFWTNNVADKLVPQHLFWHISNIFAKLCGRYIDGPPTMTTGNLKPLSPSIYTLLHELASAVGSPPPSLHALATCPTLESIFYRSLRVLMRGYDPLTPVRFDNQDLNEEQEVTIPVDKPIEYFQPPDVLWTFVHIGEPNLYIPLLNAIKTSLWACPDTRRGISLLLLLGRLQGGKMSLGVRNRPWARNLGLYLEQNGCSLPSSPSPDSTTTTTATKPFRPVFGKVDEEEIKGAMKFVRQTRIQENEKRKNEQRMVYQVGEIGNKRKSDVGVIQNKGKGKGKGKAKQSEEDEDEDYNAAVEGSKSKSKRRKL